MLKIFSIILISIGLVCGVPKPQTIEQIWAEIPHAVNGSQCLYLTDLMKFSCRGLNEIIECNAVHHLNGVSNIIYGLGRAPVVEGESIKYWMYPRLFNTTVYLNHTILLNKTDAPLSLSLYQSDKFIDFGIRVPDLKCFQRLTNFFEVSTVGQVVELESDLEVKPTVTLLSEILVRDRNIQERAFAIEALGGRFPVLGFPFFG